MPAIIRKSLPTMLESRREILHAIRWQVRSSVWSPPTDIYETDDHVIVRVEIAGMRDEDFEVTIERHALFIAGIRPDFGGRRAYHQMEILSGRFEIEAEITVPVEVESSTAEYKDGFLTISLPKSKTQKIEVEE